MIRNTSAELSTVMLRCWKLLLVVGCYGLQPVYAGVSGLIVVGLGGTSEYRQMFETAANETRNALSGAATVAVSDDSAPGTANPGRMDLLLENAADRETILAYLDAHIEFLEQEDGLGRKHQFVLALFGHGNYDGDDYKFNVPGPDITARDLNERLSHLDGVSQLLVLATSASGAATQWLEHDDRILVTATKSGAESNVVQFPRYWTEALTGLVADSDHDEQLSITEAYDYTVQAVADHYENRQQLATEHARLTGIRSEPTVLKRIGSLAGTENDKRVNALLEQRQSLEQEFNAIRDNRGNSPQSIYLDELEVVLVRIARLQQKIDAITASTVEPQ